jgi:heme-degrading monooxygenase HmoA
VTTVITVYDLPADADAPARLGEAHTLHRALAAPASFGWIDLGEAPSLDAAAAVVAEAEARPGALSGRYDAFHVNEHPAEPFGAESDDQTVIFVNCMRFPAEEHDAAFAAWERVNHYMVRKPGYRWHRLHRRVDASAPFGLVNVVEWESPAAWQAAHDDGFRALTSGDLPFTAQPTLCRAERARPGAAEPSRGGRSEGRSALVGETTSQVRR